MTTQNGRGRLDSGSGLESGGNRAEVRQESADVQAGIVVRNCAVNHTYGYQIRGEACFSHWCGKR